MKPSHAIRLFAALILMLSAGAAAAMDADELIAKNLAAMGGLENIQAVKSTTASGKALAQGMEFPFSMQHMRPNRMRLDVEVMGMKMVQAYDGEKGWSINPMTGSQDPQPMGEMENKSFKLQSDMDGLLVGWQDKGYKTAYIGEADVEGTPTYQLQVDTGDGIVIDMFMDQEYFLVIKQSATISWDDKIITQDTFMSDFQQVGKLTMPFAMETRMGETTVNQIVLEKVEFDQDVDPAIFVMPAAAPAAPTTDK